MSADKHDTHSHTDRHDAPSHIDREHLTAQRKLAISSWVNDQFETQSLQESTPPADMDRYQHWASDPASGLTGTVYLVRDHVWYTAFDGQKMGWWDIGLVPASLDPD